MGLFKEPDFCLLDFFLSCFPVFQFHRSPGLSLVPPSFCLLWVHFALLLLVSWGENLLTWYFPFYLMQVLDQINLPFSSAVASSHRFWCILRSFPFSSTHFLMCWKSFSLGGGLSGLLTTGWWWKPRNHPSGDRKVASLLPSGGIIAESPCDWFPLTWEG